MAVNMYSAIWTLLVCMVVAVGVSLFTKPKPDAELKNLVMGLTPLPDEGPCPWYQRPMLWATVVFVVLVAINVVFLVRCNRWTTEHQVPIWFFIGGLLLIYGIIISARGSISWSFRRLWSRSKWRCSISTPTSGGAAC